MVGWTCSGWEAHVNAELRKFHAVVALLKNQDGLGQKIQRWFTARLDAEENVVQWGRANLKFVMSHEEDLTYPTFNYTPISDTVDGIKVDEAMALFEGNTVFATAEACYQQLEGFHCPRLEAAQKDAKGTDSKKRIAVLQGINALTTKIRKTSMYSAISRALCKVMATMQSYGLSSYDLEQQERFLDENAAIVQLDRDKRRTYVVLVEGSSDFPLPFDHEVLASDPLTDRRLY
ncbi:hypothetical protein SPFM12_00223 [Salmonella phage SPFM12]|nr:hypothetical protein SPFM12_00223 [Salmonella phage SPFM12]